MQCYRTCIFPTHVGLLLAQKRVTTYSRLTLAILTWTKHTEYTQIHTILTIRAICTECTQNIHRIYTRFINPSIAYVFAILHTDSLTKKCVRYIDVPFNKHGCRHIRSHFLPRQRTSVTQENPQNVRCIALRNGYLEWRLCCRSHCNRACSSQCYRAWRATYVAFTRDRSYKCIADPGGLQQWHVVDNAAGTLYRHPGRMARWSAASIICMGLANFTRRILCT